MDNGWMDEWIMAIINAGPLDTAVLIILELLMILGLLARLFKINLCASTKYLKINNFIL